MVGMATQVSGITTWYDHLSTVRRNLLAGIVFDPRSSLACSRVRTEVVYIRDSDSKYRMRACHEIPDAISDLIAGKRNMRRGNE